jgi:hypothetical protein
MTEPTDAEIVALMRDGNNCNYNDEGEHIDFARAVLAKWGTPAPVGAESIGYLYCGGSYGDELADWEIVADQCQCDKLNEHHGELGKEAKLPLYTTQPAPVQSGLVATMLDALRHAQKVLNHNNLHLECGPVNAAILAARAPVDSVLEAQEPFAWHVCSVNSDGSLSLEHAAAWEEAAHEHINDAITEHDIEGAGSWVVRPAYHAPQPSPAAQGDALDAARYRLVRRGQHWSVINGIGNGLRAEELDAAIDAAMAAQREVKP